MYKYKNKKTGDVIETRNKVNGKNWEPLDKPDTKKPDTKKPDTKKPDTKKPDDKKPGAKKGETKKEDEGK